MTNLCNVAHCHMLVEGDKVKWVNSLAYALCNACLSTAKVTNCKGCWPENNWNSKVISNNRVSFGEYRLSHCSNPWPPGRTIDSNHAPKDISLTTPTHPRLSDWPHPWTYRGMTQCWHTTAILWNYPGPWRKRGGNVPVHFCQYFFFATLLWHCVAPFLTPKPHPSFSHESKYK